MKILGVQIRFLYRINIYLIEPDVSAVTDQSYNVERMSKTHAITF